MEAKPKPYIQDHFLSLASNLTPQASLVLVSVKNLPSVRVRNGSWLAGPDARRGLLAVTRFAWGATVSHLLALVMFHKHDGFVTEEIKLIGTHFEYLRRADFDTLAASIALIRSDGDIPVPGTVLKPIIGYHVCSAL